MFVFGSTSGMGMCECVSAKQCWCVLSTSVQRQDQGQENEATKGGVHGAVALREKKKKKKVAVPMLRKRARVVCVCACVCKCRTRHGWTSKWSAASGTRSNVWLF